MTRSDDPGERHSIAKPRRDPVLDSLQPVENLAGALDRIATLEEQIAVQKAAAARGQPNEPRPPPDDSAVRVYSVKQTAEILGLGLTATYQHITKGRIPAIKLGGTWLVPHVALARMLAEKQGEAV